ncbi:hypothetical protein GF356_05830 [candidate division GN15 bacterium]|nr:hypothetical protein [candidate division GN15 bacterium]
MTLIRDLLGIVWDIAKLYLPLGIFAVSVAGGACLVILINGYPVLGVVVGVLLAIAICTGHHALDRRGFWK